MAHPSSHRSSSLLTWFVVAACSVGAGATACSSSENGTGPALVDGGVPQSDAGAGGDEPADAQAGGDAADAGPSFVSNTPGAKPLDVGTKPAPDVKMVSSNFLQEQISTSVFVRWYGAFTNVGTTTVCQVEGLVHFRDAAGTELMTVHGFVDAAPFQGGPAADLVMPCIAPGKRGLLYTIDQLSALVPMEKIATVAYELSTNVYAGVVPAPLAPKITSEKVVPSGSLYQLQVSAVAGTGSIYNLVADVYPRDAKGLTFNRGSAFHLDTLDPGATWSFTAGNDVAAYTEYDLFIDFLNGP